MSSQTKTPYRHIPHARRCAVLLIMLIVMLSGIRASLATGNIHPTYKWAWSTGAGWINFDPENGGVAVFEDHLEGYAWSENLGWIRLGTHDSGGSHTYANDSETTYGVNRTISTGALSGYAWSTNAGWINFAPDGGGVTVSATGEFSGYAWGESIGWISFQGTAADATSYKVATTIPLAVVLIDFYVTRSVSDALTVTWETAEELNHRGFNLFRGITPTEPDRRLNTTLIPSQSPGSPVGSVYTWEDREELEAGLTYYYWLEAVEFSGASSMHGPVSGSFTTPTGVTGTHLAARSNPGGILARSLLLGVLLLSMLTKHLHSLRRMLVKNMEP